ncbi:MAG: hypothetical protein H7X71_04425 [Chitinophagales bacterium]|nr:hypothetical protein [Chitinophagales bacterium]
MKKLIYIFTFLFFATLSYQATAQVTPIDPDEAAEEEDDRSDAADQAGGKKFWDRIVIGGNVGALFGNYTYVDVSPLVGYKITDKFIAGAGLSYQYVSYHDPYGFYADYKLNVIGPRAFGQYDLILGLFAYTEYEYLWVSITPEEPYLPYKDEIPGLFPGLGYKAQIGDNAYLKILALYNVLYDPLNPLYNSAFQLRFGFSFGG